MEVVGPGRLFELGDQAEAERSCVGGLGVDHEGSAADVGGEFCGASDDVDEERRAEPSAFVFGRDAEPGEKGDGLGVAAGAFAEPSGRRANADADACHAPGVVRDHIVTVGLGDDQPGTTAARLPRPIEILRQRSPRSSFRMIEPTGTEGRSFVLQST